MREGVRIGQGNRPRGLERELAVTAANVSRKRGIQCPVKGDDQVWVVGETIEIDRGGRGEMVVGSSPIGSSGWMCQVVPGWGVASQMTAGEGAVSVEFIRREGSVGRGRLTKMTSVEGGNGSSLLVSHSEEPEWEEGKGRGRVSGRV